METRCNEATYGAKDGEYCPECGHAWTIDAPAHFTDCRYFSLDDDRDEQPSALHRETRREMVIGDLQKAAA